MLGGMGKLIAPVVAPGTMAEAVQPTITIDDELLLRPWEPGDVAVALEAFSTPDIQHWHFRRYDDEAEAGQWIAECAQRWVDETCATWAIVDRATSAILGRAAIHTNLGDGYGEVSYWVLPGARGRRVATRACVAVTRWAHELGLHRVHLEHSTQNQGSRQVAVAAGFIEEGVRRGANLHADGWHDMRMYSHLATDPPR